MGDRRQRIHPEQLVEQLITLPSLDEQRRIVSRIDAIAVKIAEARALREVAIQQAGAVLGAALSQVFDQLDSTWANATIDAIAATVDAGWSPQCDELPAKADEWGILKTTSVQWCSFLPQENKRLPTSSIPRGDLTLEEGDVLVTRAGPMKRVGVPATVRERHSRLMISDKLIRIRPRLDEIDPRFLEYAIASPIAQKHLVARKTGLADAQVNISQSILRSTPIAYPPLAEQRRIIAELDALQAKVDAMKALQTETAAELDAMLPAILDRAFKGEL
jgi:type I restriction enzyme S subunit